MRSRRTRLEVALAFGPEQKSRVAVKLFGLWYRRFSLRVQQQPFLVVLAQQLLTCTEKLSHHSVGFTFYRMVSLEITAIFTCIKEVPNTFAYSQGLIEKGTFGRAHTLVNDNATSSAVPAFRNCHYITFMHGDSHDLGWDDPTSNSLVDIRLVKERRSSTAPWIVWAPKD